MTGKGSPLAIEVRKAFEETLRKHTRRLAGINHELSNIFMTLDLLTLTVTVLLVEREKELAAPSIDTPGRYDDNSLLQDLSDLGLDDQKKLRLTLQVLIQKQYVTEITAGQLVANEPAFKLTQLFDTIYPKMPGLNLVGYFNQLSDELLTNRKTMDLALAQLNKTLQTQGVSQVKKIERKPKPKSRQLIAPQIQKSQQRRSAAAGLSKTKPMPSKPALTPMQKQIALAQAKLKAKSAQSQSPNAPAGSQKPTSAAARLSKLIQMKKAAAVAAQNSPQTPSDNPTGMKILSADGKKWLQVVDNKSSEDKNNPSNNPSDSS